MSATAGASPKPIWTVPVATRSILPQGSAISITADESVRAAAAHFAGVVEIPALAAEFRIVPQGDGFAVKGRVRGRVVQTCVVTLDPVENTVDEEVDLLLSPTAELPEEPGAEIEIEADEAVVPEPLTGNSIDLGAIALEFLVLGLDPYPRKSGVVYEEAAPAPEKASPFAALAGLKNRQGGDGA